MMRAPVFSAVLFTFTSWESISPQSPQRCRWRIPLSARATSCAVCSCSSAWFASFVIPTCPSEKSGDANAYSDNLFTPSRPAKFRVVKVDPVSGVERVFRNYLQPEIIAELLQDRAEVLAV